MKLKSVEIMGISCDFEAGSMESEIKPTCNKEFIKLNGQHELDGTQAKMATAITINHDNTAESDAITIDDAKSTDDVILISPIPTPETETIVIVDDAEPEEGEIITSDNEFEYEAISSDEEFTLRQQIEALEAKNRELEKIASISARAIDYGYRRSPNYYKSLATAVAVAPNNRSINHTKSNPPLSSVTNYKTLSLTHVENISSDEAQLVDSDAELPSLFDSNKYTRSHRASKKEKRQSRRKARTVENDKERCVAHGKRRCTNPDCYPIEVTVTRKKRVRHKYDDRKVGRGKYISDSEDELLRNREELKMALNIIEPSNRTVNSSSLSHKLSAIQNQHDKSSGTKHRKRKSSRSPDRRRRPRSAENSSKRSRNERDRSSSRIKLVSPILSVHDNNDNDIEDDEAISLEEQELRLIALKSAVLKKHEARKRKQLANQMIEQVVRPYSPTDSVVLVADETGDRSNDCIDSDNNNMDISPISSPGNQYQPMDMDLASSNENSKSPIFSYDKPQTFPYEPFIDWGTVHIPVAINPTYVDIDQAAAAAAAAAAMSQPFAMQPSFPMIYETMQKEPMTAENSIPLPIQMASKENNRTSVHIDNEDELRAQLIEQMRSTNTSSSNSATESMKIENVPKENSHIDSDSLEEDCLRSLLLSSKGKKSAVTKDPASDVQVPTPVPAPVPKPDKLPEPTRATVDPTKCDDMPKIALNLREALKRLEKNKQNKLTAAAIAPTSTPPSVDTKKPSEKCVQLDSKPNDSLQDCDQKEIQKTVVNNRLDKNENELCNSVTTAIVPLKVAAEENPTVIPNTANQVTVAKASVNDVKKGVDPVVVVKPPVKVAAVKVATTQVAKGAAVAKPKSKVVAKPKINEKPKVVEKPKLVEKPKIAERPHSTTPPVTKTTVSTNLNKMEAIRKSTSSPIITTWTAKPVKKLIIQLNEDSTTTDDDDFDESVMNKKTDADSGSQSNDSNNTFQLRLDQFLQNVRQNTDAILQSKQVVTTTPAKATAKTAEKSTSNATQKVQVSTKGESSKAVAHLPMSSQLEYHRLLNRMKQLEKQKEQKSRLQKETTANTQSLPAPAKTESNYPSLTVVIQNENRFIQTIKPTEVENDTKAEVAKIPLVTKLPTNKPVVTSSNTSLAKKVLVKNAMAQATDVAKLAAVKPAIQTAPVSAEQSENKGTADATAESKPALMTLAMFEKKTPKARAALFANYIKKYKNHGEQYLNGLTKLHRLTCRTNLETKKQQKLEQVLDELRRQAKVVEVQLAQQKTLTKSLYPAIAATQKAITTDRTMLLKLENACNRLGNIVKGPDYKVQCDKDVEIKEKLREILIEKSRLKLLGQKTPATTQPAKQPTVNQVKQLTKNEVASNKVIANAPKPTPSNTVEQKVDNAVVLAKQESEIISTSINSIDKHSNVTETKPADIPNEITQQKTVNMEVDDVDPKPSTNNNDIQNESIKTDQAEEIPEIPKTPALITNEVQNDEKIPANETKIQSNNNHITKANEIEPAEIVDEQTSSPDNFTTQAPMEMMETTTDPEAIYGKYDSPLDHMQPEIIDSKPSVSAADRNAIVCPFDLMGRCEDKQCQYKHLSV